MIRIKVKDTTGKWHEFEGNSKDSIIEQCEKQGIDCPFACRAGACTVCVCKVNQGSEDLVEEFSGDKLVEVDEGNLLSCIAGLKESSVDGSDEKVVELDFENV